MDDPGRPPQSRVKRFFNHMSQGFYSLGNHKSFNSVRGEISINKKLEVGARVQIIGVKFLKEHAGLSSATLKFS